jgi:hypothetical protein
MSPKTGNRITRKHHKNLDPPEAALFKIERIAPISRMKITKPTNPVNMLALLGLNHHPVNKARNRPLRE